MRSLNQALRVLVCSMPAADLLAHLPACAEDSFLAPPFTPQLRHMASGWLPRLKLCLSSRCADQCSAAASDLATGHLALGPSRVLMLPPPLPQCGRSQ